MNMSSYWLLILLLVLRLLLRRLLSYLWLPMELALWTLFLHELFVPLDWPLSLSVRLLEEVRAASREGQHCRGEGRELVRDEGHVVHDRQDREGREARHVQLWWLGPQPCEPEALALDEGPEAQDIRRVWQDDPVSSARQA